MLLAVSTYIYVHMWIGLACSPYTQRLFTFPLFGIYCIVCIKVTKSSIVSCMHAQYVKLAM